MLGEKERSIKCLKKAFGNGYGQVRDWVKSDPDVAAFHDDPEFRAFIA